MGQDVTLVGFGREDRQRYRQKVRRCLDVLALMLDDFQFDVDGPTTGVELELNLIDGDADPAMRNAEVLANLTDAAFQTELGQFNLELNLTPRLLSGGGFDDYERDITAGLHLVREHAAKVGATVVMIGILPTVERRHTVLANLSMDSRYQLLNERMVGARGEDMAIDLRGVEHLQTLSDSIAPESACTSVQFHLQVPPGRFAGYWNAAQAIAAVQVALGANSPYLYGKRLWAETRIPLFLQATDTRSEELKSQGVRPRVWFGERWITSIFDLFEENVRYFPPLLLACDNEDPVEVFQAGGVPVLSELRLHNGTVYRWNRPVYDITAGRPHLRVENRPLPAGPTVVDMLANAAFYFGLVRELAEADRPVWSQLCFSQAEENFYTAARYGLSSRLSWPRSGQVGVRELVLDRLLPKAYDGLDRFGTAPRLRDRLLGVIEQRCRTGRNGATWQTGTVDLLEEKFGLDRPAALRAMLRRYVSLQYTNEPVHAWPIG